MGGNDTPPLCKCHGEPMWKHGKKYDGSQRWLCRRSRGGSSSGVMLHKCGTGRWVAGEDRPRCKTHDVPMYSMGKSGFTCRIGHKKSNGILRAAKIAATPPIPCRQCGSPFQKNREGWKYCSKECAKEAEKERNRIFEQSPMRRLNKHLSDLTRVRV